MTKETDNQDTSVHYKKFEDDEASGDASNDIRQAPQSPANHVPDNRSRVEPPEVITVDPDVTDSPTAILPRHEVVLPMNGLTPTDVPGTTPTDQSEEDTWTWLNLVLSIASIFCCTVCGILATVTAILAYIDHRVRDFEASRQKRMASYGLALTALIAGIICMVIVIVVAIHYDNMNKH